VSDQVSGDTASAEQSETSTVGGSSGDEARSPVAAGPGSETSGAEGEPGAKKKRRRRRRKKKPEGADDGATSVEVAGEAAPRADADGEAKPEAAKPEAARRSEPNRNDADRGRRSRGDDRGRGQRGDDRGRRDGRGRDDRDDRGGPRRGRQARGGGRDRDGGRGREDTGLKVSLFSALAGSAQFDDLADRQVTCRKPGCNNTWSWSREAQVTLKLQGAKIKPPSRLCDEHWAEERSLKDQPVECRVRGCERTWIWNREAQLKHRAWYEREKAKLEADDARNDRDGAAEGETGNKKGKPKRRRNKKRLTDGPPARLCGVCEARIKHLENIEQPCKVHGCGKTWTWTKESQLEGWAPLPDHVMPNPVVTAAPRSEAPSPEAGVTEQVAKADAVPNDATADTADTASSTSKVEPSNTHDAEAQSEGESRAKDESSAEGGADTSAPSTETIGDDAAKTANKKRRRRRRGKSAPGADGVPVAPPIPLAKPPRRMCKSCVEFCRAHQDREVECGKPECQRTWTYKIGAQLQDQLAGRNSDPIKLACDFSKKHFDCEFRGQQLEVRTPGSLPPGAEVMPCVVPGCTDSWVYLPGARLDGVSADGAPVDRMCDPHRTDHGAEARDPRPPAGSEPPPQTNDAETETEPTSTSDTPPTSPGAASVTSSQTEAAAVEAESQLPAGSEPAAAARGAAEAPSPDASAAESDPKPD